MQGKQRYLKSAITEMLNQKMVFLGGPRQVGKTTLCLDYLEPATHTNPSYLNWDDLESQKQIKLGHLPSTPLVILDEIHKFKNWRNLVKGFYDKKKDIQKF